MEKIPTESPNNMIFTLEWGKIVALPSNSPYPISCLNNNVKRPDTEFALQEVSCNEVCECFSALKL